MLKKIIGMYLILVAVLVGAHTVIEPLYHVSTEARPYSAAWDILNPMMIVALLLALVFAYQRKNGVDSDQGASTREFIAANTLFYGFLFVSILFFWNWFNLHSPEYTAIGNETVSLAWIVIDALLSLLTGAMGVHLVRNAKE
ncbi:MAG: hypothetical protein OXQ89_04515 [Rhodospirillaceae bacterium]|nr:hypothetical protein [Rhodospirillaceae bacterium]MDD9996990.1 hypothetical protein [Rhodospirillaceae bacterium]MDE0360178.1 hypothetical protein [Rhodospirillaceae bacterium]